ncbi:MAG TPA: TonB-dependent receptor plug domain-containing protein, partial [Sphingobacteriaceae bacterium]|nr:TonB-dependent receptor plug domain-containing protein [Sphingobacteriaceae bacterium]
MPEKFQTNDLPPTTDTAAVQIAEIVVQENRLQSSYAAQNKNIRILDKELLTSLPVISINEALGHVSGVDVRQRGPFGLQADLSVDGGTFEQTLILINGVRMLDAQTAHHAMNLPLPMDAIERIEVIRGPAARVYGINSLTGVINIITKTAANSGIRISSALGSSLRAEGMGADKNNLSTENNTHTGGSAPFYYAHQTQLSGDYVSDQYGSHSLSLNHSKGNGHRYNTAFEQNKVFYQSNWKVLSLMTGYVASDFGANGFYAAPGDQEARELVNTGFFALSAVIPLSEFIKLKPKFSYRGTDDDYRYYGPDLSKGRSEHSNHAWSSELHLTWSTSRGEFGLGTEWRKESINSTNIGVHGRSNFGSYTEYRTAIG